MHLVTHLSRQTGGEIRIPDFPVNFAPVPSVKYITVCTGAPSQSRIYDYFNKVLSLVGNRYRIVQIGSREDYPIAGAIDNRGLGLREEGFILSRSSLHLGNDHVFNSIAASKGVPSVSLHSFMPEDCARPLGTGIVMSLSADGKPSYSLEENPKRINSIKPEDVANTVLEILGLSRVEMKTVYIGPAYLDERIDFVPDFPIPPGAFNGRKLVCRYDLVPNPEALAHFLFHYGGPVITRDPLPPTIFNDFRGKIKQVIYYIDNNLNLEFLNALRIAGIPYELVSESTGKKLQDLKLELWDYNQIKSPKKHDISRFGREMKFDSNRFFFSQNKFYPTRWHWERGITSQDCDFSLTGIESCEFQESLENLYIYE